MTTPITIRFGELLRERLEAQGAETYADFAEMLGLQRPHTYKLLNGQVSPTLDTLGKIGAKLGIDVSELIPTMERVA